MSDTAVAEAPRRRGRKPNAVKAAETAAKIAEKAASIPPRPSMRPDMKEDSPRSRAAKRAAEIRGNLGGGIDEGTDEFAAPPAPDGWTYEWKRHTTYGKEDPAYQVQLAHEGWEPVPTVRHPHMMPGGKGYELIERKGMVLMERPAEITNEVRSIELRRARQQVRMKEQQLATAPEGTMTRDDARVAPKIKRSFEPIPIPEDQ